MAGRTFCVDWLGIYILVIDCWELGWMEIGSQMAGYTKVLEEQN